MILAGVMSIMAMGFWPPEVARAGELRIGMQVDIGHLGIQIGSPPPLVVVPRTYVYQAPSLPYNYFVYQKRHYLFHDGNWLSAKRHGGPWTVIALEQVPRSVRGVPVEYYRNKPGHWKQHGPPPWAEARGRDKDKDRGFENERERGGGRGHGKGK
jgi:hypothetical protein